jgi:hypothetical protein
LTCDLDNAVIWTDINEIGYIKTGKQLTLYGKECVVFCQNTTDVKFMSVMLITSTLVEENTYKLRHFRYVKPPTYCGNNSLLREADKNMVIYSIPWGCPHEIYVIGDFYLKKIYLFNIKKNILTEVDKIPIQVDENLQYVYYRRLLDFIFFTLLKSNNTNTIISKLRMI